VLLNLKKAGKKATAFAVAFRFSNL